MFFLSLPLIAKSQRDSCIIMMDQKHRPIKDSKENYNMQIKIDNPLNSRVKAYLQELLVLLRHAMELLRDEQQHRAIGLLDQHFDQQHQRAIHVILKTPRPLHFIHVHLPNAVEEIRLASLLKQPRSGHVRLVRPMGHSGQTQQQIAAFAVVSHGLVGIVELRESIEGLVMSRVSRETQMHRQTAFLDEAMPSDFEIASDFRRVFGFNDHHVVFLFRLLGRHFRF